MAQAAGGRPRVAARGMADMEKLTELYVRALTEAQYALEPKKGQGLVEYVLILALISIIAIAIMTSLGSTIQNRFVAVRNALNGATGAAPVP